MHRQTRPDVRRGLRLVGEHPGPYRSDRPVCPRQRALPPRLVSLQLRRRAVEDPGRRPAIHRSLPQQLEQVVINLITNACQSLKEPSAGITISTYYDAQRNNVRLKVEDQGIGIKPEDMKYIMDPFFTTKRNMGGTGLGLSVSFNIVKSHGGTLILNSKPGQGSTARVSFPAIPKEQP